MSAEAASVVRTFAVGPWTVTITFPVIRRGEVNHIVCEWEPARPNRLLTAEEQIQYDAGLLATYTEATS